MFFKKKPEISIQKMGFLQAAGVAIYCLLVGLILWSGGTFAGSLNGFLGPALMLVLFSVSVLICGLLVFYQPYRLFFDGKKKEAVELVLYTTAYLAILFLIFLLIVLI